MLGTVTAEAQTKVSVSDRLVDFSAFTITDSNFPTLDKSEMQAIVAEITKAIPQGERVIALDRVLAGIDKSQIIPKNTGDLKADPPIVFYSTRPAVVVNINGAPIWDPIAGTDLDYAVNTNWDLFRQQGTDTLYLRDGTFWLKAATVGGPWTPAGTLPASFRQLPSNENWAADKSQIPGAPIAADKAPTVFASSRPAELILLRGAPDLPERHRDDPGMGEQHRQRRVSRRGVGPDLLPGVRALVLGAGLHRTVDICHADAAGRLPRNSGRSPAIARPRVGARNAAGGGSVLIADIPQTARVSRSLAGPT